MKTSSIPIARPPRRILIIKPSSLGDVTHALPVLALVRRRWPDARISWLVSPACAGLLEGLSILDDVILFDRKRFGTAWRSPAAAMELFRFKRNLRKRNFDLVIDLQGLFRSGWLSWLTRAKLRVGFANARELAWLFYTHRVPVQAEQHAVDRYLKIAEALGCGTEPAGFPLPIAPSHRAQVRAMLPTDQPYAVLMPAANWLTKRWPVERFAALVEPLRTELGLQCVVAGGPDAVALAAQIPGAINLAGKTNLPQLAALLERADLVIANDSGPMHIAAALHRPLVAIFGPTSPVRTGPYRRADSVVRIDIDCGPCFSRRCDHIGCLRRIEVADVLAAARRQFAQRGATSNRA